MKMISKMETSGFALHILSYIPYLKSALTMEVD